MPSSYYRLLLVLLVLFQDMVVSSPIQYHTRQHCPSNALCNWDTIKHHARKLYDLSKQFYNHSQAIDVVLDTPRITCENQCGPKELSLNKEICLKKIHQVLLYYKTHLDILSDDSLKNSKQGKDIISIKKVLFDLLCCLQQYGGKPIEKSNATAEFVKNYFGTPLTSSSSVIARVFAVGDPANHLKEQ